MIGRFAPTPSGRMHLGNLYCALMAWVSARAQGGQFIVRIEDLDAGRCRFEPHIEKVFDDLRWLGLDWVPLCLKTRALCPVRDVDAAPTFVPLAVLLLKTTSWRKTI